MTKKHKIFISNLIFILTVLVAFCVLIIKTGSQTINISYVSLSNVLLLIIPIILIIVSIGLINLLIGSIIINLPLFKLNRIENINQYKHYNKIKLFNNKEKIFIKLCVFRC